LEIKVTNLGNGGPNNPAGLLYKLVVTENACDVPPTSETPGSNNNGGGNNNNNDDDDDNGRSTSSGSRGRNRGEGEVLGAQTFCGIYIDRYLRKNYPRNNPEAVRALQEFLNEEINALIPVTGIYDDATEQAVMNFQAKYKGEVLDLWGPTVGSNTIAPTGIFYLTTLRWANMIKCPDLDLAVPELINWSMNPSL
jgi:hypothetical protein